MDSRRERRFETDQPATVTCLRTGSQLTGRIVEVSGGGMRVLTPLRLPADDTVKVECNDTLWLGEVSYSEQVPEGGYATGLRLEHALYGTAELARFAESFLAEAAAQRVKPVAAR